jgi:hypothetical protein
MVGYSWHLDNGLGGSPVKYSVKPISTGMNAIDRQSIQKESAEGVRTSFLEARDKDHSALVRA